jgi:sugar-specific transcriptional regulator TrmB
MSINIFEIETNPANKQIKEDLFENIKVFFELDKQTSETIYNNFAIKNKFINEYKVDTLKIEYNSSIVNLNTYLLDLNKNEYTILEKYIYEIAKYHFDRLNIELTDNYDIEFWLTDDFNKNVNFHVDQQEIDRVLFNDDVRPFLTTVTYFNDNIHPTMITNMTDNNKHNINDEEFFLSFPITGKQIVFEGSKYLHSPINIFNKRMLMNNIKGIKIPRYVLNIQFWESKQKYRPYYIGPKEIPCEFNKEKNVLVIGKIEDSVKKINTKGLELRQLFNIINLNQSK